MSRARAIAFSAIGGATVALLTANVAFAQGFGGDGFGRHRRGGQFMMFFPLLLLLGVAALLISTVSLRGR
ncbi:MAG: hypothetical protein ABI862_10785 [Ilumatobacteraceae bacterium]